MTPRWITHLSGCACVCALESSSCWRGAGRRLIYHSCLLTSNKTDAAVTQTGRQIHLYWQQACIHEIEGRRVRGCQTMYCVVLSGKFVIWGHTLTKLTSCFGGRASWLTSYDWFSPPFYLCKYTPTSLDGFYTNEDIFSCITFAELTTRPN